MRPLRLELSGFTAFREPVTVDFADAELFALVGPTGSGKSSLIDAMCFACYGTVPRLDRRAVEPIISAGRLEARVRLDFAVGGRDYSAVRVVRRLKPGRATTKEARLECAGAVLAGDADAVTARIEELLGFGFDQFTKCVVLPQGEFARFLHDPPRARQDLLVRLLDLGVYERLHEEAQRRRAAADTRRQLAEQRLAGLAGATDEALTAVDERLSRLDRLRDALDDAEPALADLAATISDAESQARQAREHAARLAAVRTPEGVVALADEVVAAEEAKREADAALGAAITVVETATATLAAAGDRGALAGWAAAHARRADLAVRVDRGEPLVAEATAAVEAARGDLADAEQVVRDAEQALQRRRDEHAAAHLAANLVVGEACPVCAQPVEQRVDRPAPRRLADADAALERARGTRKERADALEAARERLTKLDAHLEGLREELATVDGDLVDAPDPATVQQSLEAITAGEAALAAARHREGAARRAAQQADGALTALRGRAHAAWERFDAARDRVAVLAPPPPDRGDLAAAWQALTAWATMTAAEQARLAASAAETLERARAAQEELEGQLRRHCADAGVEVAGRRPRDACVEVHARAQAERTRLVDDLRAAAALRKEVEELSERQTVAGALARHLAAAGFERWLLDEALERLVDGASEVLRELSAGQYSLAVDDQHNFAVVDHRNADERRSAKTLSGGETFLASLALALTLAEHIAELAVATAPRLEAIFLDEGFGTLDADTLEVVATAIEELGARGRTVGIVTHVRELAERVPVRFEVRRGPATSTVERVTR